MADESDAAATPEEPDAASPGDSNGSGESRGSENGDIGAATPEELLARARTVRKQARRARHGYWFPLALFGLLTTASLPFYIQPIPTRTGTVAGYVSTPWYWRTGFLGGLRGPMSSGHLAYYWLAAMLAGLAATALWYRLRGNRIGLRTPSRGFVVTGLVLLLLALLIPALPRAGLGALGILMPRDLVARGTFPLVLIGIGICVLAWAERSVALTLIAAGYLSLSLVASLYNIANAVRALGWNVSPSAHLLPNVVLPALVLLLSGVGAWLVQRRQRPPGGHDATRAAPPGPAGGRDVAPAGEAT